MRLNGNLVLNSDASGEIQHAYIERLAAAPTFNSSQKGRIFFNTNSSLYYYNDGAAWVPFATGGNAASLQSEVDAIEAALGGLINTDGTYVAGTLTGSLAGTSSLTDALKKLQALADANGSAISGEIADRQAAISAEQAARIAGDQANSDALAAEVTRATTAEGNLQTAIDAEATTRANADAALTQAVSDEAAARTAADTALQTAISTEETTRAAADTALSDRITKEVADRTAADQALADAMQQELDLRFAADTTLQANIDAEAAARAAADVALANKIESAIAGMTWEAPVDEIVADHTAVDLTGKTDGYRVVDTTDHKIYTVAGGAFDGGELLVDGAAFFNRTTDVPYVFNGTSLVQFNGASGLTAGAGLVLDGNTLNVVSTSGTITVTEDSIDVAQSVLDSITNVASNLAGEVLVARAAESGLGQRVDDEIAARTAADTAMQAAYIAADAVVKAAVDAEVVRATAAEGALQTAVNTEVADRTAADTALGLRIDGVSADVSAEVSRAEAAEAAIVAKIGKMYFLYEAGSASTAHVVAHGLNQKYCNVTIVDDTDNVVIPQAVVFDSNNQLTVTFTSALQCKVIVMGLAA